ncbi:MAG: hypothetical protein Q7U38_07145, partial [Methylobacter sp.]|nr:hypothetical protein [Methylobacter sp.]
MTDSMDKKLKEKRDNFDVDLDAMQDEAEPSFLSDNEFQIEDDAIDRLLMNTGFDADNPSMQAGANPRTDSEENADTHDELDEFLNFGNDLDRLLMDIPLGLDDVQPQTNEEMDALLKELDDIPDVSDAHQPELPAEGLFAHIDTALSDAMADDSGTDEALTESSWLESDETADLMTAADALPDQMLDNGNEQPILTEDETDEFSDFSDFNEPDIQTETDAETSAPAIEELPYADALPDQMLDDGAGQPILTEDETDEFSDFSDFNEPD